MTALRSDQEVLDLAHAASRWAAYRPAAPTGPRPVDLEIRPATRDDCATIAAIEASRDGVDAGRARRRCEAQVDDPDTLLLVALVATTVVGFARAACLRPSMDAPSDTVPEGWYLLGVVVVDSWRRHGIGRALTVRRIGWIARRADAAYYYVNARNRASLDLHRELGFVEVTRRFSVPGIEFEGGKGILCRADLSDRAEGPE